jgi:hypothetical protein
MSADMAAAQSRSPVPVGQGQALESVRTHLIPIRARSITIQVSLGLWHLRAGSLQASSISMVASAAILGVIADPCSPSGRTKEAYSAVPFHLFPSCKHSPPRTHTLTLPQPRSDVCRD